MVWRLAPDRLLLRRVRDSADSADTADADVVGGAALVWIALDEPADVDEISRRLREVGVDADPTEAIALLADAGWIRRLVA